MVVLRFPAAFIASLTTLALILTACAEDAPARAIDAPHPQVWEDIEPPLASPAPNEPPLNAQSPPASPAPNEPPLDAQSPPASPAPNEPPLGAQSPPASPPSSEPSSGIHPPPAPAPPTPAAPPLSTQPPPDEHSPPQPAALLSPPDADEPVVAAPSIDSAPPGLRVDLLIELTDLTDIKILNEIGPTVAERRGLPLLREVPIYLIRRSDIVTYFESGTNDADRREDFASESILRLFGLLGETDSLVELQRDLVESGVLGFYDPDIASFVIVSSNDGLSSRDLDTVTHEFVHALQDQHFQIGDVLEELSSNSDARLAFRFVIEGDARVAEGLFGDLIERYGPQIQTALDILPAPRLAAPAIVKEIFFSPYIEGALIATRIHDRSGFEGINGILAMPPASTEQLLRSIDSPADPASLEPIVLPNPDVRTALGGADWLPIGHDTIGEFIITEYLDHFLPPADAARAGGGWGGDRLSLYVGPNDTSLLAWHTAWDTHQDASEFFEQYVRLLSETANNVVELASGRAVTATDGNRSIWIARNDTEVWAVIGTDSAAVVRVQEELSETLGLPPTSMATAGT